MVVPENARSPPALHRGSLGQRLAGPGHAGPVPVSAPAQIPRANVRCRVSLSVRAEAGPRRSLCSRWPSLLTPSSSSRSLTEGLSPVLGEPLALRHAAQSRRWAT